MERTKIKKTVGKTKTKVSGAKPPGGKGVRPILKDDQVEKGIPKAPFSRVVKEITHQLHRP